jgi:hypothetical protein
MDPISYFKYLHDTNPSALIVPLHDSEFNRSKSSIAWIEACFAGSITIAPSWEEWERPGCLTYSGNGAFKVLIKDVKKGEFDPTVGSKNGWNHVMENLQLRDVNRLRMQVIENLMAGGKVPQ